MNRRLTIEPPVLLRKLRSVVTGRHVVFASESRHRSETEIRRFGRIVAVHSDREGWRVRDRAGALHAAGPGLSALYSSLPDWHECGAVKEGQR